MERRKMERRRGQRGGEAEGDEDLRKEQEQRCPVPACPRSSEQQPSPLTLPCSLLSTSTLHAPCSPTEMRWLVSRVLPWLPRRQLPAGHGLPWPVLLPLRKRSLLTWQSRLALAEAPTALPLRPNLASNEVALAVASCIGLNCCPIHLPVAVTSSTPATS